MRMTERRLRRIIRKELLESQSKVSLYNESLFGKIKDIVSGGKEFSCSEEVLKHVEVFSSQDSRAHSKFETYEVECYNIGKTLDKHLGRLKACGLKVRGKVINKISISNVSTSATASRFGRSYHILDIENLSVDHIRHDTQDTENLKLNSNIYALENPDYTIGVRINYKISIFVSNLNQNNVDVLIIPFSYEILGVDKKVISKGKIRGEEGFNLPVTLSIPGKNFVEVDKEMAAAADLLIRLDREALEDKHRQTSRREIEDDRVNRLDREKRKRQRKIDRGDEELPWWKFIK